MPRRPVARVRGGQRTNPINDWLDWNKYQFRRSHTDEMKDAAELATKAARESFDIQRSRRPNVPERPGRPTTGGSMSKYIQFSHQPGKLDRVRLERGRLDSAAPYWLIQEIGTGKSRRLAEITDKGSQRSVEVAIPSQVGRKISRGLAWENGGRLHPPSRGRYQKDQLTVSSGKVLHSQNQSRRKSQPGRAFKITIKKEIKGKGFVDTGIRAARLQYRAKMRNELTRGRRRFRKK